MDFVITLVITAALSVVLRTPIKKCPWLFYGLCAALVALMFARTSGLLPGTEWKFLVPVVQQCSIAFSLFVVVMFIGCLPDGSQISQRMRSIRSELSIMAFILCLGHMVPYFAPYANRVLSGTADSATTVAFVLALVIGVLLVVLGVTSFAVVKRTMSTAYWKRIQSFAYVFFGLAYVHLVLMMLPSALHGARTALTNVAIYSIIAGLYAALRIGKAVLARKTSAVPIRELAFDDRTEVTIS